MKKKGPVEALLARYVYFIIAVSIMTASALTLGTIYILNVLSRP